jgi:hypothetical protein
MQIGTVLADKEQRRKEVRGSSSIYFVDIYLSNVTTEPEYGNIWRSATMANFVVDIGGNARFALPA